MSIFKHMVVMAIAGSFSFYTESTVFSLSRVYGPRFLRHHYRYASYCESIPFFTQKIFKDAFLVTLGKQEVGEKKRLLKEEYYEIGRLFLQIHIFSDKKKAAAFANASSFYMNQLLVIHPKNPEYENVSDFTKIPLVRRCVKHLITDVRSIVSQEAF